MTGQAAVSQTRDSKRQWNESFQAQIQAQAFNSAPVEALVRNVSYYLRDRRPHGDVSDLHFLEMGCGTGPNLRWLARKGIKVSGIDISTTALQVCKAEFARCGLADRVDRLVEGSVAETPFDTGLFDGIMEACVFQHLEKELRESAFGEIRRLLKPGGIFCGYMLGQGHSVFQRLQQYQLPHDPGTLDLQSAQARTFNLENLGLSHFFCREELIEMLDGFSVVDTCQTTYELPRHEADRRGYDHYQQSMWAVYAVK